ncbi:uncharacterized protein LOC132732840 [Ruditapes philippinarum]|uniref:uncharacterized protein LOC132732840 n=1 Tax=Ruditapes philippinarum TaxID=129788 RepID=UPI00295AD8AC|nr:uncharacterized protein LOC132732840 [Ruditapes philippinarum]
MSDNPEKCANYLRIVRFTVDVGTDAVRDLLYYSKARDNIASFFAQRTISDELLQLKRKHIITKEQYERIISCENVDNFDLSLLITLLTNIFAVTIGRPACGWDNPADENNTSIAADLLRLKDIRNTIIGHKSSAQISSEEYKSLWKDLENIFIRIKMVVCGSGESEKSIRTKLEVYISKALEPTDEIEERYANLIQRWHDEFTTLQNEVERLCERTTGKHRYCTIHF